MDPCDKRRSIRIGAGSSRDRGLGRGLVLTPLSFLQLPLPQPHAGTAAVFIDELDAGGFQRLADRPIICARERRFTLSEFGASDSRDTQGGLLGEVLRAP